MPAFFLLALISGIFSSVSSGLMGSYVIIKKISSITGSIAHCILAGIGASEFLKYKYNILWMDPLYGSLAIAILASFLIGWVHLYFKQNEDAIIAIIWACGMAIGVIFLSLIPGKSAACTHFLFGDLFSTSVKDNYLLGFASLGLIVLTVIFYRKFLIICFDEDLAYLQKIWVKTYYFLLLSMISIAIVLLTKIIGIILIIALLTIPASIANFFTFSLVKMFFLSIGLCLIFNISGLYLSYFIFWPPGASISIIATIFYLLSLGVKKLIYRND